MRFLGSCAIETASADDDGVVVHTSTHGDSRCDVVVSAAGFRSSLPPELAGADTRTLAIDVDEQLRVLGRDGVVGMRRLRLVPAPPLGPDRDTALGSRALERPPRRRVDPRLD